MHKILLSIAVLIMTQSLSVLAAKLPDDVTNYINTKAPSADIRFDGVIILPNGTVYLPLYPSLFSDIHKLKIKESVPSGKDFEDEPDVIIFNNDFVLLKVLTNSDGQKTVLHMQNPPLQVRTGLLPQDMLVPSGLLIPENLKGIIGNLNIDTKKEDMIKTTEKESFEEFLSDRNKIGSQTMIPQLNNKIVYITTNYSKNIQVLKPASASTIYSLAQKSIPIEVKAVEGGRFLLVTSYDRPVLDVVSVADSRFIKQIPLGTNPEEIVIDESGEKAYITAPSASTIFVIDLKTMSIIQKIRVNGYCEKLHIAGDKIFYADKMKGDIWSIETKNDYILRNMGKFPNISALMYCNDKLYIASRTKSRIAVIDYNTLGLESEYTLSNKPVAMISNGSIIYVLTAQNNIIEKIDTATGKLIGNIKLPTDGFSTGFNKITGTNLAVISDVKENKYTIFDLSAGKVIKTYKVSIPVKNVIISDAVKLFD